MGNKKRCKNCGSFIGENHDCNERNKNVSKALTGRKQTEESNIKRREKLKGRNTHIWTDEERIKFSALKQKIPLEDWQGFKNPLVERLKRSSKWKIWRR